MVGDSWSLHPVMRWLLLILIPGRNRDRADQGVPTAPSIEARTRAILASAFTDLAILDRDGVLEDCNDNWARTRATANPFTAAKPGQPWLADSPGFAAAHPARKSPVSATRWSRCCQGAKSSGPLECEWQADGEHRIVASAPPPPGSVTAAPSSRTSTSRPASAWKSRRRRALHELAHMNMRAGMGELVSAVTHELTQSLTASFGNAQALKRMLPDARLTREDLAPLVDDIAAANREASHVIERVRQLMRKEAFDMQPVDLNAIVMEVVQVLNSSAANEGVLLVADLDPDLPAINADRVQLRQVAMNLVLNAVQATRSQPGRSRPSCGSRQRSRERPRVDHGG